MELVKDPKFNWLGMKWYFIVVSVLLVASGAFALYGGQLTYGVDFTGGTLVKIKFQDSPPLPRIRAAMDGQGFAGASVSRIDDPSLNQVQIRIGLLEGSEEGEELSQQTDKVFAALRQEFNPDSQGIDFNNASRTDLVEYFRDLGPALLESQQPEGEETATNGSQDASSGPVEVAQRVIDLRTQNGGLLRDFSELESLGLPAGVTERMRQDFFLGSYTIISSESVGPKVGSEMKDRARNAVLFSLMGMLAYIWFRFQLVYGVAAIVALFHDVFITVGFFALFGKEVSLTVIAALLTLVGYSLNDTIVIFDRVRENTRLMRRRSLTAIINTSINQTLNRTILTSVTFFMAALALYLLGGEALDGFSFALVVGVLVGTYSSVAIASPIVVWWHQWRDAKKAA
ncbi:MAG TPA: protein translocase subunit SecF [Acidobacteriota bacterium]|nr:protein translocase subunit SecF [Acidobacteriota bacterium]